MSLSQKNDLANEYLSGYSVTARKDAAEAAANSEEEEHLEKLNARQARAAANWVGALETQAGAVPEVEKVKTKRPEDVDRSLVDTEEEAAFWKKSQSVQTDMKIVEEEEEEYVIPTGSSGFVDDTNVLGARRETEVDADAEARAYLSKMGDDNEDLGITMKEPNAESDDDTPLEAPPATF